MHGLPFSIKFRINIKNYNIIMYLDFLEMLNSYYNSIFSSHLDVTIGIFNMWYPPNYLF